MTFKLRSEVTIFSGFEYSPRVANTILVREKVLRPGHVIRTRGDVTADVEGKGAWASAKIEIRIIDNERFGIKWKRGWLDRWPFPDTGGYFDEKETIIKGKDYPGLEKLGGSYSSIDTYKLPEAFSILEKIRIPYLIRSRMKELKGIKDDRRETKLIYEPTLPPQSRK